MSSYKLKKWYPSLPKDWKVGMLVTKKDKDDIDYIVEEYGEIRTFLLQNDKIFINEKFMKISLPKLVKVKQPLFKTEDGKEIYEGDNTFGIDEKYQFLKFNGWVWKKNESPNKLHKHFSTKEKAEEYIIMNKPCLSINDLKTQFNLIGDRSNNELALKELVKSKI